ncbi:hypothetical protein ABEB36_008296 [Hypothenemus hampei]|uniref:Cell division cycle protein 16 homolog n=1 Tax=Hypothenemus hampei TaxID=57062 RepID=A0ABD1ELF1_HYPHA
MKISGKMTELIEKYRKLVQKYLDLRSYNTAMFWADRVVVLTDNSKDVFWLAHCMYMEKQYHRAAFLLKARNLEKKNILCTSLAAKCYFEALDLEQALQVINNSDFNTPLTEGNIPPDIELGFLEDTSKSHAISSFLLLKGRILAAMDNRSLAANYYKQALRYDVYCFEALDLLTRYQMLSSQEEYELLNSLPFAEQCSIEEVEIVKHLYEMRLKKFHTPMEPKIPNLFASTPDCIRSLPGSIISTPMSSSDKMQIDSCVAVILSKFQTSLDFKVSQAEILYYNGDYDNCLKLTETVLQKDPYHEGCLPIHIACLVEYKQSTKLFSLGHKLVNLYPNKAISWYAVGCYYYVINNNDSARGNLTKATSLDKLFGPAWLVYGHSFANEKEHDQAMAAYFKASQLMKGCHLPHLYIGIECGLTNNVWLAEKFFEQAQAIAPNDPFTLQERGLICFQKQEYEKAEQYFNIALEKIRKVKRGPLTPMWAPLLNNLGHVCRKLKKYDQALEYHNEALILNPQHPATVSAVAFVYSLMDKCDEALEWFHKALSLNRDDTFSRTMLNSLLERAADDLLPYSDSPNELPNFKQSQR